MSDSGISVWSIHLHGLCLKPAAVPSMELWEEGIMGNVVYLYCSGRPAHHCYNRLEKVLLN